MRSLILTLLLALKKHRWGAWDLWHQGKPFSFLLCLLQHTLPWGISFCKVFFIQEYIGRRNSQMWTAVWYHLCWAQVVGESWWALPWTRGSADAGGAAWGTWPLETLLWLPLSLASHFSTSPLCSQTHKKEKYEDFFIMMVVVSALLGDLNQG